MTALTLAVRPSRRSRRAVARTHAERAVQLVTVLAGDSRADSRRMAAEALRRVAGIRSVSRREFELVRAAVSTCGDAVTTAGLERLVLLLTDVDGWMTSEVADALELPVDDVSRMRTDARARVGAERLSRRECRGWGLVGRRGRVTDEERAAADAHLGICRLCRERLREQQQVRDRLHTRSAAVTATVLADVVALTVPAGGATAAAVVGAGALAVAVTSAGVAVDRGHAVPPPATHRTSTQHGSGTGSATTHRPDAGAPATTAPPAGATGTSAPYAPVPRPRASLPGTAPALPAAPQRLPVATALPTSLPTAMTTLVPTPLQTAVTTLLPTPLPTVTTTLPIEVTP